MHVLVFTRELVEQEPWLPKAMISAWDDAKRKAAEFYSDPGYSLLLFARNEFEWQRDTFGPELFPSGFASNRSNLERFIGYLADQRLIEKPVTPSDLFHHSVLDT